MGLRYYDCKLLGSMQYVKLIGANDGAVSVHLDIIGMENRDRIEFRTKT